MNKSKNAFEYTDNIYIEQAEYIQEASFKKWSATHPNEDIIIKKLSQSGAKVITGPRGCGKTTLMLKVYNRLIIKNSKKSFAYLCQF